jgi:superfamily II DNA helicase RecQ
MKLKVFTLRWDEAAGGFDDGPVQSFLHGEGAEREVLDVSEHFFVHERMPVWALMLTYRDVEEIRRPRQGRDARKDWRAELGEDEKALYDEMRSWRAKTAKRDRIPPYLILTNRQVARMAAERPATTAGLREVVEGFGEAKAARWGEEILVVISAFENRTKEREGDKGDGSGPADPSLLGENPA